MVSVTFYSIQTLLKQQRESPIVVIVALNMFNVFIQSMEGGELFAKISERTTPFTEQGNFVRLCLFVCSLVS